MAKEFDEQFQNIFTQLVEITFEFVNRNKSEIDVIYIYASMEEGDAFFNTFFKINGKLSKIKKINDVSIEKYNISDQRVFGMLKEGNKLLLNLIQLFNKNSREVPNLMKMVYHPKTGQFNNDLIYEKQYSYDDARTNVDGYQEWFNELNDHKL